jgi:5-deoxy-glucuronate isomerase
MPSKFIRHGQQSAPAAIHNGEDPAKLIYFNLVDLKAGDTHAYSLPEFETVVVPLSGTCNITVDGALFQAVGGRNSVWDGQADSVYAGPASNVDIQALSDCQLAVAGGAWSTPMKPFRVRPDEVDMVDVGSNETKSRRRIFHILGNRQSEAVGRLLVSELHADEGCWSGYPLHKHDADTVEETNHQELYHWRFDPPHGFGSQLWYDTDGEPSAFVTRSKDTFVFSSGYHPTVTAPGYRSYISTILVGATKRSLVQNFEEVHRPLMDAIPGIAAMRAKFR